MTNRRNPSAMSASQPRGEDAEGDSPVKTPVTGGRLWLFRLLASLGIPAVCFGLLELGLRLSGYGYPTGFLLSESQNGQRVLIQNNQFGWRFFGRELARWPCAFSIPKTKPADTVRVLVLGESAARGEPQPDFGLSRVLQTLLSQRHPGVRFEVVNTAMTAINSHVILPIARDCAKTDADVWVLYMGNNEVVGPYGAGTVFGARTPPLPLIRGSLALKTSRTGQLLDAVAHRIGRGQSDDGVWGGMGMFLERQVREDDPRMEGVYHHFEHNLADIIQAGSHRGVAIVASTVAVNLKDCPPFGSAHRPGLSEPDKSAWDRVFGLGTHALAAGDVPAAAACFQDAAGLDDTFAELRFRQGQCALVLGNAPEAQRHFQAARDWDTLRFRCDTQLNEIIRRTAGNRNAERVFLADAERAFAEASPSRLPGEELFYEHVHLTFAGNYRLARILAEQVEKALVGRFDAGTADKPWPSAADCASRLGRSEWNEATALSSIATTLSDPPFTGQLGHVSRMRALEASLADLTRAMQPTGLAEALKVSESALAAATNDPALHKQVATLKLALNDPPGATTAARRALELLPNDADGWALLGSILAQQQQQDAAAAAFRRAFRLGPQGIKSQLRLAGALAALGKQDDAERECRRILRTKPRCVPAWLQLGQLAEKAGRKAEAEECFRQALTNRSQRLPELMELGSFFQNRRSYEAAVEIYRDTVRLSPSDASMQLALGRNLASLGRYEEAAGPAAEAVRLGPEFVEARLLFGIVLWRRGAAAEAEAQFRTALRLRPDSLDAQLNLGLVLARAGRRAEALALFEEVLKRDPANGLARQQAAALRGVSDAVTKP